MARVAKTRCQQVKMIAVVQVRRVSTTARFAWNVERESYDILPKTTIVSTSNHCTDRLKWSQLTEVGIVNQPLIEENCAVGEEDPTPSITSQQTAACRRASRFNTYKM